MSCKQSLLKFIRKEGSNRALTKDDRQLIPESYIWFVFHAFAVTLQKMDKAHLAQMDQRYHPDNAWVLHMDLKDANGKLELGFLVAINELTGV
jgi:hypothetical protein